MLGAVEPDHVEHKRRFKPLTLLPLVALVFYDVSGGPFGIEVTDQAQSTLPGRCPWAVQKRAGWFVL